VLKFASGIRIHYFCANLTNFGQSAQTTTRITIVAQLRSKGNILGWQAAGHLVSKLEKSGN
jgi:hypothetical protein